MVKKTSEERSRSPRKKTPKLVGENYLAPDHSLQIFTQSATDISATEDEGEHSIHSNPVGPKKVSRSINQGNPGPTLLKVPPKPTQESRPGIIKSKSFATPGQFECSIDESAGRKTQMMAFFGHGSQRKFSEPTGPSKTVRINDKPLRSSSISSLTDEIVAEDDLLDIDAEFESLLNSTFEQESRKLTHIEAVGRQEKGRNGRSAASQRRIQQDPVGSGRRGVSLDMSSGAGSIGLRNASMHGKNSQLQKSQSFGCNSASALAEIIVERPDGDGEHSVSNSGDIKVSDMYQNSPLFKQKNFDPVASLPTSSHKAGHAKRQAGTPTHSPSPTQSEYDTCDPWDDY